MSPSSGCESWDIATRQAAAAVGQTEIMAAWGRARASAQDLRDDPDRREGVQDGVRGQRWREAAVALADPAKGERPGRRIGASAGTSRRPGLAVRA